MPFKDPERRREYHRDYARLRRAGIGGTPSQTVKPEDIKSAQGMLDILSKHICLVDKAKADVFFKARVIGYLVGVGLKLVEVAELAKKIQELEQHLEQLGRGEYGHQSKG